MTKKPERQSAMDTEIAAAFGAAPLLIQQLEEYAEEEAEKQREEEERLRQQQRKTKITPHERKRATRMVSLTFPSPEWKEAIQEMAAKWDMGQSDFLTYCVAYTMAAVESNQLRQPKRRHDRHEQSRAGSYFNLPWEPDSRE